MIVVLRLQGNARDKYSFYLNTFFARKFVKSKIIWEGCEVRSRIGTGVGSQNNPGSDFQSVLKLIEISVQYLFLLEGNHAFNIVEHFKRFYLFKNLIRIVLVLKVLHGVL